MDSLRADRALLSSVAKTHTDFRTLPSVGLKSHSPSSLVRKTSLFPLDLVFPTIKHKRKD